MENKKILIIDDDVKILNLVDKILTREGYRVVRAADGKEAVQKAIKERPHLVIADLILPDMNGAEIIQCLKEEGCNVPAIFLTAMISKTEEAADQFGIHTKDKIYPTLAKPFQETDFLELIRKELKKTQERTS